MKNAIGILLAATLVTVASCAGRETTEVHIEGGQVAVSPPTQPRVLGWLVTMTLGRGVEPTPLVQDVYRAPGDFEMRLPAGDYRLALVGLLPPEKGRYPDRLLALPSRHLHIENSAENAVRVDPSPLQQVALRDLPRFVGTLVKVRVHFDRGALEQKLTSIPYWLDTGWPIRHYGGCLVDESAGVVGFVSWATQEQQRFVEYEALVVYDAVRKDIGGTLWRGHALYIYAMRPVGLVKVDPKVEAKIEKEWDGRSPLPPDKDRDLSDEYRQAVQALRAAGIAVTNRDAPDAPRAEMAPAASETATGEADPFGEHLRVLQAKVPEGFTVVVEPPFVVIGDEAPAMVRRRARETVRWAVQRLKALYFEKDPDRILDIWLFKDKASYERHTREIFGDDPTTPFGYFSHAHGALIMNIRTGGGTLVHEIVHPFVAANFPECPAWFNEGLGTLYEQSSERDGRIVGLTNWRLKGLQETIRAGKTPSFKALTATSDYRFYNEDKGTHYAQARYLCYWLQEKGLLVTFYREFRAGAKEDPTGYETLKRVLGEEDMDAFKKRWEAWVLGLRFP